MILYSIIITAKDNGLHPAKYLAETLRAIPYADSEDQLAKLLPLKSLY